MKESKIFNFLSPILIIGTTILVILFSRGWRLDFQEKTVITTGILDMTSEPKGATVYINGEKRGKTPTVIDSLSPGKYQLELRKDLYTNWTKEIEIREEYVTKIIANLFEEKNDLTQLSDAPLKNVIFSKSGNEAIIVNTHNGEQGVWKIQLNQTFFQLEKSRIKIANLIEHNRFDLLKSNYTIIANNDFSKAILQIDKDESNRQTFLLDLLKENSEIIELTEFISFAESYQWLKDNTTIVISNNQRLETLNTRNYALSVISKWPVSTWTASKDYIYFINIHPESGDKHLFQAKLDGSDREEFVLSETIEISEIDSINYNEKYATLVLSSTNATELFSLKTKIINPVFKSSSVLVSTSPNERFSLFLNTDENIYYVFDFEENLLVPFITSVEADPKNFIWTPNSLKLFYRYTTEGMENVLVSIDYDGTNFHELIRTADYNGKLEKEFGFSSDSKEIYIPLPVSKQIDAVEDYETEAVWEEFIFKLQLR